MAHTNKTHTPVEGTPQAAPARALCTDQSILTKPHPPHLLHFAAPFNPQGFHEMPISFAPTFKFAVGTDRYDLKRTPAWTGPRAVRAARRPALRRPQAPLLHVRAGAQVRGPKQWQDIAVAGYPL